MIQDIRTFLAKDSAAGQVLQHARLLQRLGQHVRASLPNQLQAHAGLANFKAGIAVIHADNAAVAAKLRQMAQRLQQAICASGQTCTGVEIKVAPKPALRPHQAGRPKPLSLKTSDLLQSTAAGLPEGSLKAALAALLARAAKQD